MNYDKDQTDRIVQEIVTTADNAREAMDALRKTMQQAMEIIIEAWEALAVEIENTTLERARKPLRPVKSTINRQYKQPVKAVHRTARSRLR